MTALLYPSSTFPYLSLTIPLPQHMLFPVHLLYSGLGPEYPLLPLPEYLPLVLQLSSPQIFPLVRFSSNTTSPLKLSLILTLNWISQISVPNPEHSDSIEHIPPCDTVHKYGKLRRSRQPSQRCTPALPVWVGGTEFHQKPRKRHCLGLGLQKRRYFKSLLISVHKEQCGFKSSQYSCSRSDYNVNWHPKMQIFVWWLKIWLAEVRDGGKITRRKRLKRNSKAEGRNIRRWSSQRGGHRGAYRHVWGSQGVILTSQDLAPRGDSVIGNSC